MLSRDFYRLLSLKPSAFRKLIIGALHLPGFYIPGYYIYLDTLFPKADYTLHLKRSLFGAFNCIPDSAITQACFTAGPIALRYNTNYGMFGEHYLRNKFALLMNPQMLIGDGKLAFASALWLWMTPQVRLIIFVQKIRLILVKNDDTIIIRFKLSAICSMHFP